MPSQTTLDQLSQLQGDDGDVGSAVNALAQIAKSMNPAAVEREFNVLFIGMGRGEVLPYASYYLTGFLHEKPLADLRNSMRGYGIQRKDGIPEPEDHLGSLCEMMAGMITGGFGQVMTLQSQKNFSMRISPRGRRIVQRSSKKRKVLCSMLRSAPWAV